MKILVVDDTAEFLAQAKEQLVGHELVLVSSHKEAEELLRVRRDEEFLDSRIQELKEQGGEFGQIQNQAMTEADRIYEHFDAVLTDLMMPANSDGASRKGGDQLLPMGTTIALLALKAGVKRVGVVTTNHHDHVATAAFDAFGYFQPLFRLGDSVILCTNKHSGCRDRKTGEWGNDLIKYWDVVLEELLEEVPLSS